jgi:hypothetical protein
MNKIISASRRTDLVAFFPDWLAGAIRAEKAEVLGPSGRLQVVDLRPESVHTFVLWSKNFAPLIADAAGLLQGLKKYRQLYFHFTITGLGGTPAERDVPEPRTALRQLEPLTRVAGRPDRVSLRFDPVVYWKERDGIRTNLGFFEELAARAAGLGVRNVRMSFAQWYGKSRRWAEKLGFPYIDPSIEEKHQAAAYLAGVARSCGLNLFACSQDFVAAVPGIRPSACIDGRLLQETHPDGAPVSVRKDRTQRRECRCTESVDIGSYAQACPHSCVYCYANPAL